MEERGSVALRDLTTLQVGGPCGRLLVAATEAEVVEAVSGVRRRARAGPPRRGRVQPRRGRRGLRRDRRPARRPPGSTYGRTATTTCSSRSPRVSPGTRSSRAPSPEGWSGLEALSGIPGLTGRDARPERGRLRPGGRPDGRVGPRARPRARGRSSTWRLHDCGFGYRTSRFKARRPAVVAPASRSGCERSALSGPLAYAELAGSSARAWADAPRPPTCAPPSWRCAGARGWSSTRPTRTPRASGPSSPTRCLDRSTPARPPGRTLRATPQPDGRVKTSAAWLIEQAGFARGYGHGDARISTKHTLALTNRGSATRRRDRGAGRGRSGRVSGPAFGVELVGGAAPRRHRPSEVASASRRDRRVVGSVAWASRG